MIDDNHMTDYQEGSVIFDIEVHKLANGMHKASGMGLEVSDYSEQNAILKLQDQLQAGLKTGEIRPITT